MYHVATDLRRGIVHATLSGFFDLEEVQAFSRDEQAAASRIVACTGAFDLLIETPGGMTQSQDVIAAFRELARASTLRARRIAIVVAAPLLRLQLRRVMTPDHIRVFDRLGDAEHWLQAEAALPA